MSGRPARERVLDAACRLAGALESLAKQRDREAPGESLTGDPVVDRYAAELLDAVDAYLGPLEADR